MKGISFLKSSIYFLIPGALMFFGFRYLVPYMDDLGFSLLFSFLLVLWGSTIPLLPLSVFLYHKEGNEFTIEDFKKRFRFIKPSKKDWKLIIFIFVLAFLCDGLLSPISKWLGTFSFFAPPNYFASPFNPFKEVFPFTHFFDFELKGQWWILFVVIPLHILSMLGEEFMWRGYILPKQEVTFGKFSWILNGLQWGYIVHLFMMWNFISFLPSMLLAPFVAYKTKNTYASLFVHGVANSFLWILIIMGIVG